MYLKEIQFDLKIQMSRSSSEDVFEMQSNHSYSSHSVDIMNFPGDERKLLALAQMKLYVQDQCLPILNDPRVSTNILSFGLYDM